MSSPRLCLMLEPAYGIRTRPFRTFFSTASGYGIITLNRQALRAEMIEGELEIEHLCLHDRRKQVQREWRATATPDRPARMTLTR